MIGEEGSLSRIECSVWSNGAGGFGLRVLGGIEVRRMHFNRSISPVIIEIEGKDAEFNVDKESFWNTSCGELIGKQLRPWFEKNGLKAGDHVWLKILEPQRRFTLNP